MVKISLYYCLVQWIVFMVITIYSSINTEHSLQMFASNDSALYYLNLPIKFWDGADYGKHEAVVCLSMMWSTYIG